jgi:hypothetical protein
MVFTFKYRIAVVKKTTQELITADTSWEKTTTTFRYAYIAGEKKVGGVKTNLHNLRTYKS